MTIKEIMQDLLDSSDEERLGLAADSLKTIYSELEKCGLDSKDSASFILNSIKLFVSADKECSEEEYQFIKKLYDLKMSYDDFYDLTNHGSDPYFVEKFDELVDAFTVEGKTALCMFGLCILSCDGTLTVDEQKLFARILE